MNSVEHYVSLCFSFNIMIQRLLSLLLVHLQGRYPIFYQTLLAVIDNIESIHLWTTLISGISCIILFAPKYCLKNVVPKWVPTPLIVVVLFILISYFCDLESKGVSIIGNDIESGFPMPEVPQFDHIVVVFKSSIVIAIVTYMGNIALAKGFDQKTTETYKQQLTAYNQWCREHADSINNIAAKMEVKVVGHQSDGNVNGDTGIAGDRLKVNQGVGIVSAITPLSSDPRHKLSALEDAAEDDNAGGSQSNDVSKEKNSQTDSSFSPSLSEKEKSQSPVLALPPCMYCMYPSVWFNRFI